MNKLHNLTIAIMLLLVVNVAQLSAGLQSDVKHSAQRVWKIGTQKLPKVAWTFTKGAASVCASYWIAKLMPKLADDVSALKKSHENKLISNLFKHCCKTAAFSWLALNAVDSFMKDIEKQ